MRARSFVSICFLVAAAGSEILAPRPAEAQAAPANPGLVGTVIAQPVAAADFSLVDQRGTLFRMSSARGRVVVLSFIYTHCADLCPYVTIKLKAARSLLGPDADKVVFVAITTDPQRDTPAVIARYSKEAGLYDSWHFLTGSIEALQKVWASYGVGVHVVSASDLTDAEGGAAADDDHSQGLGSSEIALVRSMIKNFAGGYEVSHSAPFWIVDAEGRVRAVLNADALPSDLAADARALLPH